MKITILAGGVGGAKFVGAVRAFLDEETTTDEHDVRVIVNTGDDMWLAGLRVCPDLDSIMYALAEENDVARGWGRAGESERVSAELTAYGVGWPWFTLGDLDLGTHIARTAMLRDGATLTDVTRRLCARWPLQATLLPMSNDPVETFVEVERDGGSQLIHFEEWWVRYRAQIPTQRFVQSGADSATPTPEVLAAIDEADVILFAPSNPVVSVGTILGVPGIPDALRAANAPIVGVSPIIGGAPVRGMADTCLRVAGIASTAAAVAHHYGARSRGGVIDGWLIGLEDTASVAEVEEAGIRCEAVPLWMRDRSTSAALAGEAIRLAESF